MRLKAIIILLSAGIALHSLAVHAQNGAGGEQVLDPAIRLEIQGRLDTFLEKMDQINSSCKARLPISPDIQAADGYLKMLDRRLKNLEQGIKSLEVRWDNYYPLKQWDISQDEGLLDCVERFTVTKQEACDSLEVRKDMLQSLFAFTDAQSYIHGLDSTYNRLGKKAFELSLTPKTAALLEKEKQKEALLFASVEEKFSNARKAGTYNLVTAARMEALEDDYAGLKNKSEAIQAMQYKPLIQRIKDYLIGLAAVAVMLIFINMVRAKIKEAKTMRENMKKYKDSLNLNGKDEYPTI